MDDGPEAVVARLMAFQRVDEPGLVGPRERRLAHAICDHLRQHGWRIIRDAKLPKRKCKPSPAGETA